LCFLCLFAATLSRPRGVAWWGFDQTLNNLCYLRQRLRLSQKRIGAATSCFVFDFSRAIRRQHNDSRLLILCPDHPDHVKTILAVGHREAQVLNYDSVIRRTEEFFSFFNFRSSIDFVTLQGEILTHRETDRLFVVDHEEARRRRFSQRSFVSAEPHLFQLAGDFSERSKSIWVHGAHQDKHTSTVKILRGSLALVVLIAPLRTVNDEVKGVVPVGLPLEPKAK